VSTVDGADPTCGLEGRCRRRLRDLELADDDSGSDRVDGRDGDVGEHLLVGARDHDDPVGAMGVHPDRRTPDEPVPAA
jgi:hypothetical protein